MQFARALELVAEKKAASLDDIVAKAVAAGGPSSSGTVRLTDKGTKEPEPKIAALNMPKLTTLHNTLALYHAWGQVKTHPTFVQRVCFSRTQCEAGKRRQAYCASDFHACICALLLMPLWRARACSKRSPTSSTTTSRCTRARTCRAGPPTWTTSSRCPTSPTDHRLTSGACPSGSAVRVLGSARKHQPIVALKTVKKVQINQPVA